MMKSSRLGKDQRIEDNVIKNVKNLLRLNKEINNTTIIDVSLLFRLKKN